MNWLLSADRDILIWVNSHHNPVLDAVLGSVSLAGECGAIWILVSLVLIVVNRPGWRRTGVLLLATMLVTDRVVGAPLQRLVDRERPYLAMEGIRQWGVHWTGSSFPSGHAHSVMVALLVLGSQWRRLIVPLAVFAMLTCYSRPYFGMHFPLDVVVGALLGTTSGLVAIGLDGLCRRRGPGSTGRGAEHSQEDRQARTEV